MTREATEHVAKELERIAAALRSGRARLTHIEEVQGSSRRYGTADLDGVDLSLTVRVVDESRVLEEREACAAIADRLQAGFGDSDGSEIAGAIRVRGGEPAAAPETPRCDVCAARARAEGKLGYACGGHS